MSRYLRTYSGVRAISNISNESNEYERTRIKVRSFVANGYSLRIVSCSEDSFDSRPCSLIIYSNGLKFGRFVRCPSLYSIFGTHECRDDKDDLYGGPKLSVENIDASGE